ncbi:hypothetical protein Tco_0438645 [Tanacetum coccineum]
MRLLASWWGNTMILQPWQVVSIQHEIACVLAGQYTEFAAMAGVSCVSIPYISSSIILGRAFAVMAHRDCENVGEKSNYGKKRKRNSKTYGLIKSRTSWENTTWKVLPEACKEMETGDRKKTRHTD